MCVRHWAHVYTCGPSRYTIESFTRNASLHLALAKESPSNIWRSDWLRGKSVGNEVLRWRCPFEWFPTVVLVVCGLECWFVPAKECARTRRFDKGDGRGDRCAFFTVGTEDTNCGDEAGEWWRSCISVVAAVKDRGMLLLPEAERNSFSFAGGDSSCGTDEQSGKRGNQTCDEAIWVDWQQRTLVESKNFATYPFLLLTWY